MLSHCLSPWAQDVLAGRAEPSNFTPCQNDGMKLGKLKISHYSRMSLVKRQFRNPGEDEGVPEEVCEAR